MTTIQSTPTRPVHPATAAALGAGLTLAGIWGAGLLAPNVLVHGALSVAIVALLLAAARLVPAAAAIRGPLTGGIVVAAAFLVALGALLSMPQTVNEDVPAAGQEGTTLVAAGALGSLAHPTEGGVEVIEHADGSRQLVLRNLQTDPGPDLRVVLAAGSPTSDGEVTDTIDLGALKGNAGTQAYDIPAGVDLAAYDTVYIWCRAFTVGFGSAVIA